MKKLIDNISNNYDNLEILNIVNGLLNVVISDIENMNNFKNDDINGLDLGNNTYISREDLGSLVSITDTLIDIKSYNKNTRKCNECGKNMDCGYCIENGMEYYCSDDCLHKHYTEDEYLELYDDGNGDTYWTEWEDGMEEN